MRGIGFYNSDFFIIKADADLVSESLTRLFSTNFRERVGHPFFGGNLKRSLFEVADENELNSIKSNLKLQAEQYEPRATISNIQFSESQENENEINITVLFKLIGDPAQDERILIVSVKNQ